MWDESQRKAVQALSEEKGGQLLMEYLQAEIDRAERAWLRLIEPSDKRPDERTLLLQQIKYQADKGAYRRVIGMMTDPKEKSDE